MSIYQGSILGTYFWATAIYQPLGARSTRRSDGGDRNRVGAGSPVPLHCADAAPFRIRPERPAEDSVAQGDARGKVELAAPQGGDAMLEGPFKMASPFFQKQGGFVFFQRQGPLLHWPSFDQQF